MIEGDVTIKKRKPLVLMFHKHIISTENKIKSKPCFFCGNITRFVTNVSRNMYEYDSMTKIILFQQILNLQNESPPILE